jgi:hypothetical protein
LGVKIYRERDMDMAPVMMASSLGLVLGIKKFKFEEEE